VCLNTQANIKKVNNNLSAIPLRKLRTTKSFLDAPANLNAKKGKNASRYNIRYNAYQRIEAAVQAHQDGNNARGNHTSATLQE
jgi:hypothetical protein